MPKTFKGYVPDTGDTLTLESPDGKNTVELHCKPSVPGSVFLKFMEEVKNTEDFAGMARSVRDVIDAGMVAEDIPRFWAFVDDPANGVGLELLSEIAGWISEQFAGARPTSRQPA
jgi:hypothetical protein